MCAVEPWVEKHQKTLEMATGWSIGEKDATDDRLADLLSIIGSSQAQVRENIAVKVGPQTIRERAITNRKSQE